MYVKQMLSNLSYSTSSDLSSPCVGYKLHTNCYPIRQDSFRLKLMDDCANELSFMSMCYHNIACDIYMHGSHYAGHEKFFDISLRLKARQR